MSNKTVDTYGNLALLAIDVGLRCLNCGSAAQLTDVASLKISSCSDGFDWDLSVRNIFRNVCAVGT